MPNPTIPSPTIPKPVVSGASLTIISGGQSGVDRAALDAAIRAGVRCGGYCPKKRWAEDGPISNHYPLIELQSSDPADRTRANKESRARFFRPADENRNRNTAYNKCATPLVPLALLAHPTGVGGSPAAL